MENLGRFIVEAELGRGAMGVVYRGFHPGLEVPVAIKVLAERFSSDESFRRRFQREAAAIAALNHPGIVRVYDFDQVDKALFIVMEYVEGTTLRALLQERGALPLQQALDIIQQLLSAVSAAHGRGVVHRDLKPDNVILSTEGKAKVMDFGISKMLVDAPGVTRTESIIGTPLYMSPEQVMGSPTDARSDVYALGAILYELVSGRPPFTGQLTAVLHSQVYEQPAESPLISRALMDVIKRAMAKRPADRLATCDDFAGALLALETSELTPEIVSEPDERRAFGLKLRSLRLAPAGAVKPAAMPAVCTHLRCGAHTGWQCGYQDHQGESCLTWWCSEHVQFYGVEPFCRRHANVVKALSIHAGTIREIKSLPALDDRSFGLASMVGEDVNKDLTEILRRRYKSRKDVTVIADRTVREARSSGTVAWERSWSAMRSQGYETRVTLSVNSARPTMVEMRVGTRTIFTGMPDWITRRLEGETPVQADRVHFRARLVQAVTEAVDKPPPLAGGFHPKASPVPPVETTSITLPEVDPRLIEGLVMRVLAATTRITGHEVASHLCLPYGSVEPILRKLSAERFLEPGGIANDQSERPLAERMMYSLTTAGRTLTEEISRSTTYYSGPAPVSLAEYARLTTEVILPPVENEVVAAALDGLELTTAVIVAVRASINSRGSLFIYGAPGNGKTSLASRLPRMLRGPILVPVVIDLDGELLVVFDPAIHRLAGDQPDDGRWRRVERPLVQVGGEFTLEMLAPTWDPTTRVYHAPLQVKANGGVLLIDDFGRQGVTPKQILDRLMIPLAQAVDHLQLSNSGRKVEMPFRPMVAFSTNLSPSQLLDEAYLRRLAYKVHLPDPTPQVYQRIFERERQRLGIPANPDAFRLIGSLYGNQPIRGNHPRDLLERLVDVARARGVEPVLAPDLIEAAWATLFVAS